MKAIALPTSKPLPPPKAITPSQLFFLKVSTPSLTLVPVGFPTTLEYNSTEIPFFFKDNIVKIPSAFIIDKAGWKGYREGSVGISDQHALVLIAYEETSGNEILSFARKIIDDVFNKTGIKLEIEPSVV